MKKRDIPNKNKIDLPSPEAGGRSGHGQLLLGVKSEQGSRAPRCPPTHASNRAPSSASTARGGITSPGAWDFYRGLKSECTGALGLVQAVCPVLPCRLSSGNMWGQLGSIPGSAQPRLPAAPSGLSPPQVPLRAATSRAAEDRLTEQSRSRQQNVPRVPHHGWAGARVRRGILGPGPAWCLHLEAPNLPVGTGPTSSPLLPPSLPHSSPRQPVCPPPGEKSLSPPRGRPTEAAMPGRDTHSCSRAEGRTVVPRRSGRWGPFPAPRGEQRGE